ncbi:hypothetical protein SCLCIDRAFT_1102732 [Scleroderma citrinum Foug A]|uniref:Uncharacterized protein n=1 Tax=Scleroderma citrinum Foug A TaxID=1036808 RepID=A0A0C3DB88_9AGAM|nr:hypothetical protein SCLCIDRAFT_1102732 [Scleroderma citrinum Foug A]
MPSNVLISQHPMLDSRYYTDMIHSWSAHHTPYLSWFKRSGEHVKCPTALVANLSCFTFQDRFLAVRRKSTVIRSVSIPALNRGMRGYRTHPRKGGGDLRWVTWTSPSGVDSGRYRSVH